MTRRFRASAPPPSRRRFRSLVLGPWSLVLILFLAGCTAFRRELPRPGRTVLDSPLVIVPATTLSNYLVVETKWDKHGPYHFLIDTGASVTLVTPALATRYGATNAPPATTPLVRVRSETGETALLTSTTLTRLEVGGARFENVAAVIYDCASLSAHLGIKIDGILGFPLFRETLLTLDYPQSRILLQPRNAGPLLPGSALTFNNDRHTPIVPLQLGGDAIVALIDSGSDAGLSLNPAGLAPVYAVPPKVGVAVATLSGDREQRVGRLAATLHIGDYAVEQPVVDLTDQLTSLGGRLLKDFTVTFDQDHNRVTFYRESRLPIAPAPRRSVGLGFDKAPAYWRVVNVVPDSPAAAAGVQPGDLITRIEGEPVSQWNIGRYQQLVKTAGEITFTFLNGTQESDKTLKVFDLVP
ncbi:MAG TPA: aspartyl protease family protein [Opitutus sp.]|nr:aspartyl protease family protein [Opitutus sp.]